MNRKCDLCGTEYKAQRPSSKFCSVRCRNRNARGHGAVVVAIQHDEPANGITVSAVRKELASAGREDTYLGAAALKLAERIDASTAVMGFAGLVKQLEDTMASAMKGANVDADPVIDLLARINAKRSG